MSDRIESRQIAEHLSTLASLLEAEAIRINTLGIFARKDLAREAKAVRALATRLWDADMRIALDAADEAVDAAQEACTEAPGRLALVQ
jgi:hypothetical protein